MSPGPLDGRSILVTRSSARGGPLARRLESLGARVHLRSTIAFEAPADPQPARAAIERLPGYDAIVFTSGTGVRAFTALLRERSTGVPIRSRIAAVGPATARALEESGLVPDTVSSEGRSEDLAALLTASSPAGRAFLLVRPEEGRDVLPRALREAGASVDAIPFYRTVAAPEAREVAADVAAGRFDAVVFTSPSTLARLLDSAADAGALREGLLRGKRVAIGGTTASALEAERLPAHAVAERPTDTAITEALLKAIARDR